MNGKATITPARNGLSTISEASGNVDFEIRCDDVVTISKDEAAASLASIRLIHAKGSFKFVGYWAKPSKPRPIILRHDIDSSFGIQNDAFPVQVGHSSIENVIYGSFSLKNLHRHLLMLILINKLICLEICSSFQKITSRA